MDVERLETIDLDRGLEVWQLVYLDLLFPPIVFVLPVRGQSLHIGQWGTIVPPSLLELIREVGSFKLLDEPLKLAIRY